MKKIIVRLNKEVEADEVIDFLVGSYHKGDMVDFVMRLVENVNDSEFEEMLHQRMTSYMDKIHEFQDNQD